MGQPFLMAVVGVALMVVTGGAAGAFAGFLFAVGRSLVVSAVLGGISQAMTRKKPAAPGATTAASGRLETVRQALAPRQVVYGRVRIGGVLTFFETTADNQTALMIVTFTGHPVRAIRDVYYNDASTLDYGAAAADSAAAGKFAGYSTISRSLGNDGASQPFTTLAARGLSWTSSHLQRGCAKVHTTHTFSNDVWSTGLPAVSAIVEGYADIYDPRQGSPTYTGWSNNPALCIAHYLTSDDGLGADYATEIDDATLIAAANVCDERVTLSGSRTATVASVSTGGNSITLAVGQPFFEYGDGVRFTTTGTLPAELTAGVTYYPEPTWDGDTTTGQIIRLATSYANLMAGSFIDLTTAGSGVITVTHYDEPRYRLNGAFKLSEQPKAVLERMLASMAGKLVNAGGVWFIYAGAYTAPTLTFDEDDLAAPIDLQTNQSRRDNANAVKGSFVDPSNRWQPVDFPAVISQTYFQEDGGERVWRDLDLTAFVTSGTQSQRLGKIDLVATRLGLTVQTRFKLSAFRMMTGQTVALTITQLGWSAKAFEVVNCALIIEGDGRLEVSATLRETDSAVFDWSVSDEQLASVAPNTNLPDPTTVSAPTSFTFTQSTTLPDRATLSWTAPSDSFVETYQVEFKLAADAGWTVLPRTGDTVFNLEKLQPGSYNFRVKSINVFGSTSDYATVSGTIVSARVSSSRDGSLSGLGLTQLVLEQQVWAGSSAGTEDVHSVSFCPANSKIYGTIVGGGGFVTSFTTVPDPVVSAISFGSLMTGRYLRASVYVPSTQKMMFSQTISGSPTDASVIIVNPADDSLNTVGAVTGYEIDYLAYCPGDGNVWGAATSDGLVLVFNASTGALVATLSVGNQPKYLCYVPTLNEMWIGHAKTDKITMVALTGSPTYNTLTMAPGNDVLGICYCSSEDRVIAAVKNTGVVFISPTTRAVTATAAIGNRGGFTFYNQANDRIYTFDTTNDDTVYTIVPRTQNWYASDLNVTGRYLEACICPVNNLIYAGTDQAQLAILST